MQPEPLPDPQSYGELMNKLKPLNDNRGFSLIELMIVVAIVGILTMIAMPAYDAYIVRTKRAEATGALMAASEAMARYKAANFDYAGASLAGANPVFTNQVPVDGGDAYYILTLVADANTFTLTATATGSMAGKDGVLTINQVGTRSWTDEKGGVHACWPESGSSC